ncbi:NADP-dependent 3-hydroxy acid dehydrogenase YdfG [Tepidamorphus gemmatus]|jgi:NADP-dependent 3-hydroxy acid dehydrogenase YdfG|uniref:NADP-dependent 3-hydroxy acid dehydrogenase YdfG n=1 Tax=Tepidamorphus gemmatus TaxID=747076 RepID=A0A4R3MI38_9HYPH|nr:SDR family oxidoreductase [Tepidamorphus gemmatus]TCT12039.1 NADP-dependent 3-hydroxy acid dehydrogenase YdfG [Tepidamorphus gemmatus]
MGSQQARLDGRVAIVSGASAGVGAATARALAAAGARVALVARRRERLEALAAEIGGGASVHAADLYDPSALAGVVADVARRHGRLDILVNNAGSMLSSPLRSADPADLRRMTDLNFLTPVLAARAAIEPMRATGGGHLVFIGSLGARFCTPGNAVYAGVKSAIHVFAETLRKELIADGTRVTTILPGFVATEITAHIPDATMKASFEQFMGSMTPLSPADIAAAILYAVTQPPRVSPTEIVVRPTTQPN